MQRNEVEAIFQERKEKLLQGITPSTNPIAIIMGGQPACGKSFLLEIAKSDNIDKKFLSINGDLYREFHPEKAKLKLLMTKKKLPVRFTGQHFTIQ